MNAASRHDQSNLMSSYMSPQTNMFGSATTDVRPGFSNRDMLQLIFKYKWVVLISILIVSGITIYAGLRQPAYYTATGYVTIKTDQQQGAPSFLANVASSKDQLAIDPPNRRLETEMSALLNVSNVEAIVNKYQLTPDLFKRAPLDIAMDPVKPYLAKILPKKEEAPGDKDPLGDTVGALLKSTSADPIRSKSSDVTSNVIEISMTGTDPEKIRLALTSLIQLYIARSSSRDLELVKLAVTALTQQTNEASSKLAQADDALIRYALRPGAASTATNQAARSAESINAKLRTDMEALQSKLDMLRESYGEQYTAVRETRAALEQLRARQVTQSQDSTRSDATLGILERRRAQQEARYSELQRKLDQVNLYLALSPAEIEGRVSTEMPRKADRASSIGKIGLLVGGPIAGILLALTLCTTLDFLDRRLQSRAAVTRFLGLETLGAIPEMSNRQTFPVRYPLPTYFVPIATDAEEESPAISFFPSNAKSKRA